MKASSVWRVLVTALVTMEGVNAQAKLEVDPDNRGRWILLFCLWMLMGGAGRGLYWFALDW
jgi:hypothetical protein